MRPWILLAMVLACGKPAANPDAEGSCPAAPRVAGEAPRLLVQDGHSGVVNAMALSGNGRLLASAGMDGTLRLWDTQSGLLLDRLLAPGALYGVAFDDSGAMLAYPIAGSDKPHGMQVVELSTGRRLTLKGYGPFALSPDGSKLAMAQRA
ncbi:MAG TPA: hypothetical protein VFB62_11485, partial [Polyangiaceae bacterium]|nr:hypothetical protein [Polyangiaceae bacterium]